MNGKQHVCLITPGFPKDEQDDTCMPYLQTYLKESVAQNNQIEFSVISLQYPYSNKPYFWHGIPVFPCGGKNRPFPTRVFYWIRAFRQLSAIDQRKKIDVVHSLWLTECSYLGQWWTRFSHIPHIATAMGQDVLPKNRYLRILNF